MTNEELKTMTENGAIRYNKEKDRVELVIPLKGVKDIAQVFWRSSKEAGGKYPLNNWRKGLLATETMGSLLRHAIDWLNGIDIDPEDGLPHLSKVATNAFILIQNLEEHPEIDNRFKKETSNVTDSRHRRDDTLS